MHSSGPAVAEARCEQWSSDNNRESKQPGPEDHPGSDRGSDRSQTGSSWAGGGNTATLIKLDSPPRQDPPPNNIDGITSQYSCYLYQKQLAYDNLNMTKKPCQFMFLNFSMSQKAYLGKQFVFITFMGF